MRAASNLAAGIDRSDLDATLLCAARSGQIDLALAALDRGGDPNAAPGPDQRDQRSALIVAVTLPDLRFLRGLIAKGVDVNRANGDLTPLIAATRDSYQGRPDAVMTLLSNGADPRIAGTDGNTALHHAARCAEATVAALLLDASADIDAVNREGLTALGVACMNASWNVAEFLLDRGAKTEVARAQPALLLAAGVGDDDARGVKSLLKHRANPNVRGATGTHRVDDRSAGRTRPDHRSAARRRRRSESRRSSWHDGADGSRALGRCRRRPRARQAQGKCKPRRLGRSKRTHRRVPVAQRKRGNRARTARARRGSRADCS